MQRRSSFKQIKIWIFILAIIAVLIIVFSIQQKHIATVSASALSAQNAIETKLYATELSGVVAKAYYVYDVSENKVLFAKNEHASLPLASVTKLMTGYVVMNHLPANAVVTIQKSDLGYDGNGGKLVVGEKWTPQMLLNFSLILSSNDGMTALARTLDAYEGKNGSTTVQLMNQEAQMLGMHDSVFMNPTGLDISATTSGDYSSAYDVTTLLETILKTDPSIISQTTHSSEEFTSLAGITHLAINTDDTIKYIPDLIASKTGYTDLAGGNLAIAYDAGLAHPVIIVLLGSTESARFTDMETLTQVTLQKLSQ